MKQALFGLALAAVTFACASEPKAAVSDDAAPKTECATSCDAAKSECSAEKKAECSTEAKVCPVTGKEIN
jgi:hypothetical protein